MEVFAEPYLKWVRFGTSKFLLETGYNRFFFLGGGLIVAATFIFRTPLL